MRADTRVAVGQLPEHRRIEDESGDGRRLLGKRPRRQGTIRLGQRREIGCRFGRAWRLLQRIGMAPTPLVNEVDDAAEKP